MSSGAAEEPSHVPPSPEEVKAFVEWLKENGVPSTYEHDGFAYKLPFKAFTFRFLGVPATGETWDVRLGVTEDSPSGQALSISNDNEVNRISSDFDAKSGADITKPPKKEVPGRTFRRLDGAMFQEIVAAFQTADLEQAAAHTKEKWGSRR